MLVFHVYFQNILIFVLIWYRTTKLSMLTAFIRDANAEECFYSQHPPSCLIMFVLSIVDCMEIIRRFIYSHRSEPQFNDAVIKAGLIQKKGARSSNLVRRCVVLLPDRLVVYSDVGKSYAIVNADLAFYE